MHSCLNEYNESNLIENDLEVFNRFQKWVLNITTKTDHNIGVYISNTDEPGWEIKIDMTRIDISNVQTPFIEVNDIQNTLPHDWVACWLEDNIFHGHCGIDSLTKLLKIFLEWADNIKGIKNETQGLFLI